MTRKELQLLREVRVALDSGAHTLYEKEGKREGGSFYRSRRFWEFVDRYGEFVSKYGGLFDFYVNVDVIFDPKLSWEVQRYLEREYKVRPMPVVHWGEDLVWLKKYMDNYEYIGIGGLGQAVTKRNYIVWADRVFHLLEESRGTWRMHGFAMTSVDLIQRYPWFSVDSAEYVIVAGMGTIAVKKGSGRIFKVVVSDRKERRSGRERHFKRISLLEKRRVVEYLLYDLGMEEGDVEECCRGGSLVLRRVVNALFYLKRLFGTNTVVYLSASGLAVRGFLEKLAKVFEVSKLRVMESFYYKYLLDKWLEVVK